MVFFSEFVEGTGNVGKVRNIVPIVCTKASKLSTFFDIFGLGQSATHWVLEGSVANPCWDTMCPRNTISARKKWHFLGDTRNLE